MPSFFEPSAIAPALANRIFLREAWVEMRLAAHAGSVIVIAVGPLASTLRIDVSGKLEAAPPPAGAPDLRLSLSPLVVPAFLAEPRRWDEFVVAHGDPALAATLKGLAETLPWFVERAFASALGPIVGLRVADAGRHFLAFPQHAAERVGDSVASYLRDETPFGTSRADAQSLGLQTADLAKRVDALASRVETLAGRLAALPPASTG